MVPDSIVKSTKSARERAPIQTGSGKPRKVAATALPRERILNAAFSAFMEKGYSGTSTLEIATRAKVSKRELYQVCANKSGLLRDAITERARLMRRPLELPAAKDRAALAATLAALGTGAV